MLPLHQAPIKRGQTAFFVNPSSLFRGSPDSLAASERFPSPLACDLGGGALSVRDSNPEPTGYEPAALTYCANGHHIEYIYIISRFSQDGHICNKISGLFYRPLNEWRYAGLRNLPRNLFPQFIQRICHQAFIRPGEYLIRVRVLGCRCRFSPDTVRELYHVSPFSVHRTYSACGCRV